MKMKTDLTKILTVSGVHGLFEYVAPTVAGGAVAESLSDRKRSSFGRSARISTLYDIAIYTSEGEMKLSEVFSALKEVLAGGEAPSSKSSREELVSLFLKAVPNYDSDRFYVSHMKKVVDWYNELLKYASLEFVTDEERENAQKEDTSVSED